MKTSVIFGIALAALLGIARIAAAHCEVPCGIYNDKARIVALLEDITTVEKAMVEIEKISAAEKPNWNQLVRWVTNKEKHAERIQETVMQYFLVQRIKVPAEGDEAAKAKYLRQLSLLHQILVKAMKMKQTTDLAHTKDARKLIDDFAATYFSAEDLKHLREH